MYLINSQVPSLTLCFDILVTQFESRDKKNNAKQPNNNSLSLIIKINPFNVGWEMNRNVFVAVAHCIRHSNEDFVINEIWDSIYLCRMKLDVSRTACQFSFYLFLFWVLINKKIIITRKWYTYRHSEKEAVKYNGVSHGIRKAILECNSGKFTAAKKTLIKRFFHNALKLSQSYVLSTFSTQISDSEKKIIRIYLNETFLLKKLVCICIIVIYSSVSFEMNCLTMKYLP